MSDKVTFLKERLAHLESLDSLNQAQVRQVRDIEAALSGDTLAADAAITRINAEQVAAQASVPVEEQAISAELNPIGGGDVYDMPKQYADAARMIEQRKSSAFFADLAAAAVAGRSVNERQALGEFALTNLGETIAANASPEEQAAVIGRAMQAVRSASAFTNDPVKLQEIAAACCAPLIPHFEIPSIATTYGLGQEAFATFGLSRGGAIVAPGFDFAEALSASATYTAAQACAGQWGVDATNTGNSTAGTKPCVPVPCPNPVEYELNPVTLCVTSPILQNRAWPEATARFLSEATIAFEHRLYAAAFAQIIAGSTTVTWPTQAGAAAPILEAVDLNAYNLAAITGSNVPAVLVLPDWAPVVLRADLTLRINERGIHLTRERIREAFAARNVRVIFSRAFGSVTNVAGLTPTNIPATLPALLFEPGTWGIGREPVLRLTNVYDSVGLGQNQFTALWAEEGFIVPKLLPHSYYLQIPICPSGVTSAAESITCAGALSTT